MIYGKESFQRMLLTFTISAKQKLQNCMLYGNKRSKGILGQENSDFLKVIIEEEFFHCERFYYYLLLLGLHWSAKYEKNQEKVYTTRRRTL